MHINVSSKLACVIATMIWESFVPVFRRTSGTVTVQLSVPAHIEAESTRLQLHNICDFPTFREPQGHDMYRHGHSGNMYPTRQVIPKLCASHYVKVPHVDILVLVRHGMPLHVGYVNISFIYALHKNHVVSPTLIATLHFQNPYQTFEQHGRSCLQRASLCGQLPVRLFEFILLGLRFKVLIIQLHSNSTLLSASNHLAVVVCNKANCCAK